MEGEERASDRLRRCQERQQSRRNEIRKGMVPGKEEMRRLGRGTVGSLATLAGLGSSGRQRAGVGTLEALEEAPESSPPQRLILTAEADPPANPMHHQAGSEIAERLEENPGKDW